MLISQQQALKGGPMASLDDSYDPGTAYFDMTPMVPMPQVQIMQAVPRHSCDTQSMQMAQSIQGKLGMMTLSPCAGLPMIPPSPNSIAMSGITSGLQTTTTMFVDNTNGMQSYMMPISYGPSINVPAEASF
jgi:hypothetical protein